MINYNNIYYNENDDNDYYNNIKDNMILMNILMKDIYVIYTSLNTLIATTDQKINLIILKINIMSSKTTHSINNNNYILFNLLNRSTNSADIIN